MNLHLDWALMSVFRDKSQCIIHLNDYSYLRITYYCRLCVIDSFESVWKFGIYQIVTYFEAREKDHSFFFVIYERFASLWSINSFWKLYQFIAHKLLITRIKQSTHGNKFQICSRNLNVFTWMMRSILLYGELNKVILFVTLPVFSALHQKLALHWNEVNWLQWFTIADQKRPKYRHKFSYLNYVLVARQ